MPDMASVSVVLTSIKTATDIAKLLRETDVSLEKAETKLKLAEMVRFASSVMTRSSRLLGFKITEMVIGGV